MIANNLFFPSLFYFQGLKNLSWAACCFIMSRVAYNPLVSSMEGRIDKTLP